MDFRASFEFLLVVLTISLDQFQCNHPIKDSLSIHQSIDQEMFVVVACYYPDIFVQWWQKVS